MNLINTNSYLLIAFPRRTTGALPLRVALSEHLQNFKDIHSSVHLALFEEPSTMSSSGFFQHLFCTSYFSNQFLIDLLFTVRICDLLMVVPVLDNSICINTVRFLENLVISLGPSPGVLTRRAKVAHSPDKVVPSFLERRLFGIGSRWLFLLATRIMHLTRELRIQRCEDVASLVEIMLLAMATKPLHSSFLSERKHFCG